MKVINPQGFDLLNNALYKTHNSPEREALYVFLQQKANRDSQAKVAAAERARFAYAPEELTREGYKILARDRARLGSRGYTAYPGKTTTPMSSLTQRARELEEGYRQKGMPYAKKIESVFNRGNEGLSQESIRSLLDQLGQEQRRVTEGPLLNTMNKQFREAYEPYEERRSQKGEKDINRGMGLAESELQNTGQALGNLQGKHNEKLIDTLQNLSQNKQLRRKELVGQLNNLGSQKHAHQNMVNAADRARFQQETEWPGQKLNFLEQGLNRYGNVWEGKHPDIASAEGQQLAQTLRAYGIDPSKPIDEWNANQFESMRPYPGQLVAPITPEQQSSYDLLERISPKVGDTYSDERKRMAKNLSGNETIGERVLPNLYPAMNPQTESLDIEAKRRLKDDLGAIGAQWGSRGGYGSPSHLKEASKRERQIQQALLRARTNLLDTTLRNQAGLQYSKDTNEVRRLGQLGSEGSREFGNTLSNINSLNQVGVNKQNNQQRGLEQPYNDYLNETMYKWPHLRETPGAMNAAVSNNNIMTNLPRNDFSYGESGQQPIQQVGRQPVAQSTGRGWWELPGYTGPMPSGVHRPVYKAGGKVNMNQILEQILQNYA